MRSRSWGVHGAAAALIGLLLGLAVPSCKPPCTPDNCIGCCDSAGDCQAGTQAATCGKAGNVCSACGQGQACVRQACLRSGDAGVQLSADGGCLVGSCQADVCDVSTGACVTAPACDASRDQPGGCAGGRFCSGGTCRDVSLPTCSNFAPGAAPLRWNPMVNFGPVLVQATPVSFDVDTARCPSGSTRRAVVELVAYDFNGRFLPDGGYPKLFAYRENQTLTEVRDALTSNVSSSGGNATLRFSSCGPDAVTSITFGFAFENGNGACVKLP